MKYIDKIASKTDNALKYIFKTEDNKIIEFTYINKDDGKDIICTPSQTMCNLGCKFCHTTEYIGKIKCRNLNTFELYHPLEYIVKDLNLSENQRTLLISVMGCGEPVFNVDYIIEMMVDFKKTAESDWNIPFVRYAIATSIPKSKWEEFFHLTSKIKEHNLPVKLHLSLHYTFDLIRKEWMPASLYIIPSISAVDFYKKITGNAVEIHYTLIEGVNDTEQDAILLSSFLKGKDINVKFLHYNEKESMNYHASNKDKLKIFRKHLDVNNISHEYYTPPASDIGSSCGAFLLETYLKYQD
jgi:23S rRNA (adenine2503-C2)-methyltransferase